MVNNGTIPSINPVAVLFGGQALEPEESTNYSLGAIFDVGPVSVTVDYFRIEVDDRITVSQLFSINDLTQQQIDDLIASGVTSAENLQNFRFFTNDFDTETEGVDIVATTAADILGGTTDFTLSFNHTDTEVTRFNPATLDDTRIRELQEGLPDTRYNVSANHTIGDWRFLARVSYYDDWFDSEDGLVYDGEYLFDAEAAYQVSDAISVVVGAQNIFDQFPDDNPGARGGVGNQYSQFTPWGFNGGFWYARFNLNLN
ncbi:MAG: TonB-dependent receptor [Pseudomonadota bacterium]